MKRCREGLRRFSLQLRREKAYKNAWLTEGSIERVEMGKSPSCTSIEKRHFRIPSAQTHHELEDFHGESGSEELDNVDSKEELSAFLRLPGELKNMIYTYYFQQQSLTVSLIKTTSPLHMTDLNMGNDNNAMSILLVCREMRAAAKPFVTLSKITLDTRRYRPFSGENEILDYVLSSKPELRSHCSKLVISEDQYHAIGTLTKFPRLAHIEMHNHKTCRNTIDMQSIHDIASFVQFSTSFLSRSRLWHLNHYQQTMLGPQVFVEMYYYCDFLVCLPKNKNRRKDEHITNYIADRELSHTPKLARMRHTFLHSMEHQDVKYLGKEWVTTDLYPTPVSFNQLQAFHLHKYCHHLRKTGDFPPHEPTEKYRYESQDTIL